MLPAQAVFLDRLLALLQEGSTGSAPQDQIAPPKNIR
jgi:hypothetical protein